MLGCRCRWCRGKGGGPTEEVGGEEVRSADTKDALRLDEQTMGPVKSGDEGEGGTKDDVCILGLAVSKKYFHVCTQSYMSKYYWPLG